MACTTGRNVQGIDPAAKHKKLAAIEAKKSGKVAYASSTRSDRRMIQTKQY
ncbi:MAG: hypothetical protein MRQ13_03565 [Candidatus Midichloria sp.]|nr:hypothetical protein [Candidatus Midichloria sp.]